MGNDPFMEIAREGIEVVKERIKDWAEHERTHNPSFSLVVGSKSFTVDQVEQHIMKGTEEGLQLYRMIFQAGAELFLNKR